MHNWQQILRSRNQKAPGLIRAGKALDSALLDAPTFMEPYVEESAMVAYATITTPTPDRSEDVVDPAGVMLDNYRKNPVVLWDHGFGGLSLPIGKSEDPNGELALNITDDSIEAACYFAQGMCEAEQIFELIVQKIIRATSIGFRPLEASPRTKGLDRPGLLITLWELFEWSWVVVPDNPDAIAKVLDMGKLAGKAICEPLLKSLSPHKPKRPAYGKGWVSPPLSAESRKRFEERRKAEQEARELGLEVGLAIKEAIDTFNGILEQAAIAYATRLIDDMKAATETLVAAVAQRKGERQADDTPQDSSGAQGTVQPGAVLPPGPDEAGPLPDRRLRFQPVHYKGQPIRFRG